MSASTLEMKAVAISGSPRAPSKSKTLAELMLAALEEQGCTTSMIDVAELPAEALLARKPTLEIDAAVSAVAAARIIVAATPTYRALYTGALKCLFDLMPPAALAGKICVPIQTAAAPQHFLAIDYGFRPLFASLDGVSIAGVHATDEQFVDGQPNEKVRQRVRDVALVAVTLGGAMGG
ncbi:MAG: NAD(P)H-dependent oxidoreductase [Chloroflexi bacterium]|nr:NAD(P)H-dependent oxidoreductase [Chloroflexota bacterium]